MKRQRVTELISNDMFYVQILLQEAHEDKLLDFKLLLSQQNSSAFVYNSNSIICVSGIVQSVIATRYWIFRKMLLLQVCIAFMPIQNICIECYVCIFFPSPLTNCPISNQQSFWKTVTRAGCLFMFVFLFLCSLRSKWGIKQSWSPVSSWQYLGCR